MTDEQAIAVKALTEFDNYQHSPESRVLLLAIIEWLDLSEKEVSRWPSLETILFKALAARERAVWEEAAKLAESKYNHRDPSQKASYLAGDFTLDYEAAGDAIATDCRQQAEGVKP